MADKIRLTVNFRDSDQVVWPSGYYKVGDLPDVEEIKPYIVPMSVITPEIKPEIKPKSNSLII